MNDITLYKFQTDTLQQIINSKLPYWYIAGDMGVGKSLMAIKLAEYFYRKGIIKDVLVITPSGVQKQWVESELVKFSQVPYLAAYYASDNKKAETKDLNNLLYNPSPHVPGPRPLVYITCNIDVFSSKTGKHEVFTEWVKNRRAMVILDESHMAKDPSASRTKNIMYGFNHNQYSGKTLVKTAPAAAFRLCLSGTPTGGSPLDLYSQYEFLNPNFFRMNFNSFKNRYSMQMTQKIDKGGTIYTFRRYVTPEKWKEIKKFPNDWNVWEDRLKEKYNITRECFELIQSQTHYVTPYKNVEELKNTISRCTTVILKEDHLDLPEKIYREKVLEMSPKQAAFYREAKEKLCVKMDGKVLNISSAYAAITRLRQITGGFCPMDSKETVDGVEKVIRTQETVDKINYKAEALLRDLEILGGKPAIVVAYYTNELNYLYKVIKEKFPLYNVAIKTGNLDKCSDSEGKAIDSFKAGEAQVLIAQENTICQGFNLQNSCDMFFYSMDWSLIQRRQIEDRIHRIGITARPTYTDYIYKGSMDMKIHAAFRSKKTIEEMIRPYNNIRDFIS